METGVREQQAEAGWILVSRAVGGEKGPASDCNALPYSLWRSVFIETPLPHNLLVWLASGR